jgi:succinate-semialdehyde dehydrogenase / glutarate-semialdehyde dehydrogenase
MQSVNPATGVKIRNYEDHSGVQVSKRVEAACKRFHAWRRVPFGQRGKKMMAAAGILRENAGDFAALMAHEMGKPVSDGRKEIEKCAWACEHYAANAEQMLARENVPTDAASSYVSYQPLGPVLAVMPWNFPFWQVFRFAAPALMAGNVALLKHASNVPGCALAIENVFQDAGFPDGCFTNLVMDSGRIAELIGHRDIAAVTLTGSTPAGRAVAAAAGEHVKKTVLELGGSDAYLMLEDADVREAAKICATSRMLNAGQSCICAKRFVVASKIYDEFVNKLVDNMSEYTPGDPMLESTRLGPLAREDLRDALHKQVQRSVKAGAKLRLGGEVPDRAGAWYPPTVLTGVRAGQPAFDEELFGPVAAVIRADDEAHAIAIANDSKFGLGAAVFTRDIERGTEIAEFELEAGACFVNALVKSDPRLPFGGIKHSGYGRELGAFGIREFVNIKTVYVA